MNRGDIADKIIRPIQKKFDINTREFNLIRDAILDTCIHFENRTCENCKHFINYHKACREEVIFYGKKKLPKDFGCNKWEC